MSRPLSRRDLEALSAHLDGGLSPGERAKLEARLQNEPELLAGYQAMERTRTVLRAAPRLVAPRNFTLSADMAGEERRRAGRLYPTMRLAWALATALFVLVFLGDAGSSLLRRNAAIAPAVDQSMEAQPMEAPEEAESETPKMMMAVPAGEIEEEGLGTPLPERPATEVDRGTQTYGLGGGGPEPTATPSEQEPEMAAKAEATETETAEDLTMMAGAVTEEGGGEAPMRMKAPSEPGGEIPLIRYVEGGLILTAVVTGLAAWVLRRREG